MFQKLFLLVICLTGSFIAFSQENAGLKPVVDERFDKLFLSENFDSAGTYWTTVSNSENLILVQDGEYILNRKATTSSFAAIGSFKNNLTSFRLVTSLKLEKSSANEASIGLIFMAQTGGNGGFIFEINKLQQYRLRQIAGGVYRYLSGKEATGGWIKSTILKNAGLPNLIEVKTSDRNYDIYLNNILIISFSEIAYKSGDIGFLIGPASKGRVDFLYLFTNQKGQENSAPLITNTNPTLDNSAGGDILALAESIIELKTQINKINEENEDLQEIINSLKNAEKENISSKQKTEQTIKNLELQNKKIAVSFDSLLKVNQELLKYKEMVKGNDNGDLVINLSKSLKAEKLKNLELSNKLKELSGGKTPIKNDSLPNPVNSTTTPNKNSGDGFTLPKEN